MEGQQYFYYAMLFFLLILALNFNFSFSPILSEENIWTIWVLLTPINCYDILPQFASLREDKDSVICSECVQNEGLYLIFLLNFDLILSMKQNTD